MFLFGGHGELESGLLWDCDRAVIVVCIFISIFKVTGGNRGIGYAVVKRLSKEFNGVVIFTGN